MLMVRSQEGLSLAHTSSVAMNVFWEELYLGGKFPTDMTFHGQHLAPCNFSCGATSSSLIKVTLPGHWKPQKNNISYELRHIKVEILKLPKSATIVNRQQQSPLGWFNFQNHWILNFSCTAIILVLFQNGMEYTPEKSN